MIQLQSNPNGTNRRSGMVAAWRGFLLALCLMAGTAMILAVGAARVDAREPLAVPGATDFYQRVLSLPGATAANAPGQNASGAALPIFSILYVFDRMEAAGTTWLEVGGSLRDPPLGWLPVEQTQEWSVMLVMTYAPPGQRSAVTFYETFENIEDIVAQPDNAAIMQSIIDDARAGVARDGLVSFEQAEGTGFVNFSQRPFLMPILDHGRLEYDDGTLATAVQVASINASADADQARLDQKNIEERWKSLRIGVVFVIDTTISMGPYIKSVQAAVRQTYAGLQERNLLGNSAFGLVGFRSNMDEEPQKSRLEYVSKVYQGLDPTAAPDAILANVDSMAEAVVSTHAFAEDGIAGLHEAIEGLAWDAFDIRFVFFISDASALNGNDPRARHANVDIFNIRDMATRKGITIVPFHLQSQQAKRVGDVGKAEAQYRELGLTGEAQMSHYVPIPDADQGEFDRAITSTVQAIAEGASIFASGAALEKPTSSGDRVRDIVYNEMFSAQLRFLGRVEGTEAPRFFRAWASDRDMANSTLRALNVGVFLTRNQLNALAQSLDGILAQAKAASTDPGTFFSLLQSLSAATSQDPSRHGAGFSAIGESNLLPEYLALLPYRSDVLRLTDSAWRDMGFSGQQVFIDTLQYKLNSYREVYASIDNWTDLGTGDPGSAVYLMPLGHLP